MNRHLDKDHRGLSGSAFKKCLIVPELLLIGLVPCLLMLIPDKRINQLSAQKMLSMVEYAALLWAGILTLGVTIGYLAEHIRSIFRHPSQ